MLKGIHAFEIELNDQNEVVSGKIQIMPDTPSLNISLDFAAEIYDMALIDEKISKLSTTAPIDLKQVVSSLWPKKN